MWMQKAVLTIAVVSASALLMGCPPPNALHTLTLEVEPPGSGALTAAPAQTQYLAGMPITLTAEPSPGFEFVEYQGAGLNTTAPTTQLSISQDETVVAIFRPIGAGQGNLLADPGFERGEDGGVWVEMSQSFGNVICDEPSCGRINGLGARTGVYWAFFGGTPEGTPEMATLAQEVLIPDTDAATLQFQLAIPAAAGAFTFNAQIDGTPVFQATADDQVTFANYQLVTIDVTRFADGDVHTVGFSYLNGPSLAAPTAVFVDDVSLVSGRANGSGMEPLAVAAAFMPEATVGQPFSAALSAAGGSAPFAWEAGASGALPPGLDLTSGGTLQGTPEAPGGYTFEVLVRDAFGAVASGFISVSVLPAATGSLAIANDADLPGATAFEPYSFSFDGEGGQAPYLWSAPQPGQLPDGLSITSGGTLQGTPGELGRFVFAVAVEDSLGTEAQRLFSLEVLAPGEAPTSVVITTDATLPGASQGTAYDISLSAAGGAPPYLWTAAEGPGLPDGLTLTSGGSLRGVPEEQGQFVFTLNVEDAEGASAAQAFTLFIGPPTDEGPPPLAIVTEPELPDATRIVPYQQTLTASGGTPPYFWAIGLPSGLPDGFELTSGGTLQGSTASTGSFAFTARVTDAQGATTTRLFTLDVVNP